MDLEARRVRRVARRLELRRRRRRAIVLALLAVAGTAVVAIVLSSAASTPHVIRASTNGRKNAQPGHHNDATAPSEQRNRPPGRDAVPILMYHVIAAPPAGAPFPGLYVDPGEFAEQMQALARAGWHAVTPDQVQAYWHEGTPLGAGKPIVLSFDNGYESQFTQALPVLRRHGWVGEENIQLSGLPPSQGGLSQRQIGGLLSAGWELDTQGFSHADLITLDAQALHYQVAVARQELRRRFHVAANWFCYPSGHYDPTVIAAVRAAGYTGSTTVVPGWAHREDDPYRLHRLRVLRGTTGSQLLALLAGIRGDPPAPASYPSG